MNFCENNHCLTCSDEALPVKVLHVDQRTNLALVLVDGRTEKVDITLIGKVEPGDTVLVHGGVAIGRQDEEGHDEY